MCPAEIFKDQFCSPKSLPRMSIKAPRNQKEGTAFINHCHYACSSQFLQDFPLTIKEVIQRILEANQE